MYHKRHSVHHIANVIFHSFLFVGIRLEFTKSSYEILEQNGPVQPVLSLSNPVDCCSTISVWVIVKEIDARRKYLCNLLHLHKFSYFTYIV